MNFFISLLFLLNANLVLAKQVLIDTSSSTIEWLGQKKIPGGDHKGTVAIAKGAVNINDKVMLMGGSLLVDMKSITNKDLSGKWKAKLEAHLNSEDFFYVEKYPQASFKVTKVESVGSNLYRVTGNFTLRGNTNTETFQVKAEEKMEKRGKKRVRIMVFTGEVSLDRTKYGLTYNSETKGLKKAVKIAKDKIIKDQIKLTFNLKTKKI